MFDISVSSTENVAHNIQLTPLIQMGDYIDSIALLIIGSAVMDECLHNVSMH